MANGSADSHCYHSSQENPVVEKWGTNYFGLELRETLEFQAPYYGLYGSTVTQRTVAKFKRLTDTERWNDDEPTNKFRGKKDAYRSGRVLKLPT